KSAVSTERSHKKRKLASRHDRANPSRIQEATPIRGQSPQTPAALRGITKFAHRQPHQSSRRSKSDRWLAHRVCKRGPSGRWIGEKEGSTDWPSRAKRLGERAFVEIVKLTSDGKAVRQLAEFNGKSFETFGEIVGRRLAFESGVHRQDDLVDSPFRDAADELVDRQVLGADAF